MTSDQTDEAAATEADAVTKVAAVSRGRLRLAPAGAFLARPLLLPVVALVLAVALGAVLFVNHRHSAESDARDDAPGIVADHVTKLLSYTPETVTADLTAKKKWLTGDFLNDYTVLITDTVGPAAIKGGVTARATVVATGVQAASSDRVELLMFINVETTRTGAKAPENDGSRVRVVAKKVDGSWLISSLSPV